MADNQGKENGFFRHLLSGNSSRPTLLKGDPHKRGVMDSARRARQEEAVRHSVAQRSSALNIVRTRIDDEYVGDVVRPTEWTVVRGSDGRFARGGPSSSGASECAGSILVDNESPRGRRGSQSAGTDWLVTSPYPGGPTDTRLIPSYEGT